MVNTYENKHCSAIHSVFKRELLCFQLSKGTRATSPPAHKGAGEAVYLKGVKTVALSIRPEYWLPPELERGKNIDANKYYGTMMTALPLQAEQVTCYARNFCGEAISFLCHNLSGADCFPVSSYLDSGLDPDDPHG